LAEREESHGAYDRSGRMLIGRSVGSAAAQEKQVTDDQYAELQKNFAEAYNRKDADAMAAALPKMASESRVGYSEAVTPSTATFKTC
jgi:hypothetical protein